MTLESLQRNLAKMSEAHAAAEGSQLGQTEATSHLSRLMSVVNSVNDRLDAIQEGVEDRLPKFPSLTAGIICMYL